jgi:hypothetical protein
LKIWQAWICRYLQKGFLLDHRKKKRHAEISACLFFCTLCMSALFHADMGITASRNTRHGHDAQLISMRNAIALPFDFYILRSSKIIPVKLIPPGTLFSEEMSFSRAY